LLTTYQQLLREHTSTAQAHSTNLCVVTSAGPTGIRRDKDKLKTVNIYYINYIDILWSVRRPNPPPKHRTPALTPPKVVSPPVAVYILIGAAPYP